jgi:hypothetical protein
MVKNEDDKRRRRRRPRYSDDRADETGKGPVPAKVREALDATGQIVAGLFRLGKIVGPLAAGALAFWRAFVH